jgi:Spy/CpxP family protein refolding chaperone
MATELGLSATQQAKIKKIFEGIRPQMQALPRGPESRDKRMAIMKSVEPQIMAVLTPAQQHKVNAAGGLGGMMRRGRGGGGGGGGLFERTLSMMKLNATEKSKTSALVAEMRTKFEAMRKGETGPPSVDQVNKMHTLSDHYKKAIEAVLTPANKAQFEKISASRPGGGRQGRDPGQPGGR